jgi:siroheme synthase
MRSLLEPQELLTAAPAWAERVYVGKRGGTASIKQPQIDELLVTLCQQVRSCNRHGNSVVPVSSFALFGACANMRAGMVC